MARQVSFWIFLQARGLVQTHGTLKYHTDLNRRLAKVQQDSEWVEETFTDESKAVERKGWEAIRTACVELELIASVSSIDRMLKYLDQIDTTLDGFWKISKELDGRLVDELEHRHFLSLTLSETEYFREPQKGWEAIIERFAEATGDIEESRKCFALSRYAAAVFHSIQVVEIGLIALGKVIGVADPLSGWTAVTGKLQAIQKTKYQDRSPADQKHSAFLEQLVGTVEGLKNAWRNKVSHAHGKLTLMTSDFSPEIAEEILLATRAFMRRLATEGPLASEEPLA